MRAPPVKNPCYRPFEKYESIVNDTNLAFEVTKNENFYFWNVNRLILKNNWHFIVAINNFGDLVPDIVNLVGIYGIKRGIPAISAYNFAE